MKPSSYLFFFLLATTFVCCYSPESGCLDLEATNFSFSADEDCAPDDDDGDCPCEYPILSFGSIDYQADRTDVRPGDTLTINGQSIVLNNFAFFLSGFQFIRSDGTASAVEDTISLTVFSDGELRTDVFIDDFARLDTDTRLAIGSVRRSGMIDSLRFLVGLPEPVNTVLPDSVNNQRNVLAEMEAHFGTREEGYIFQTISFSVNPSSQTRTVNVGGLANLVEIRLPLAVETPIGTDFSIGTLLIDYGRWLDGINFVTDSDAVIGRKLVENAPTAFTVSN